MELSIEGRVALVLGASQGLGHATAAALATEGVRVAMASRSRERIEAAAEQLEGEVVPFVADTDDLDRMTALPAEVAARLGPVDILVANTGGPPPGRALENSINEWEGAYRSLVLAPRLLIEAVLPGMRTRGWGRIVSVGSSSTLEPIPTLTLSNAHRLATIGFLKTLAREVASRGVTVNTIATGRFATQRLADNWGSWEQMEREAPRDVPAGRLGSPEEYGEFVAFLCSDRAAYLTGTVIPLDGGLLRSI